MPDQFTPFKNTRTSKIILLLSIGVFMFWLLSRAINVYDFPVAGAIFEILWLPLIALILALPIFSLIYWIQERFNLRSFYLYALLIAIITILLMVLI